MFSFLVKNVLLVRLIRNPLPRIIALAAITGFGFGMVSCKQSTSHSDPTPTQDVVINLVNEDVLSKDIVIPAPTYTTSDVTFIISGNYQSYRWHLDGVMLTETGNSLTLYKSDVGTNPCYITVTAFDAGNTPYSGAVSFKFN